MAETPRKKTYRLEKEIEKAVGVWCKKNGYYWRKFTSPAQRGVPDRIAISPTGKVGFLELKRKGQKPTDLQVKEIMDILEHRGNATWVDNYEDAITFLEGLRS